MSVDFESAARLASLKRGIETKTGESYPDLTGGVNALIAGYGQGSSGGSSPAVYSGSFTPAENVLSVEIPIGGTFSHFAVYAIGTVTGYSVKSTAFCLFDVSTPICYGGATNNSGTSLSALNVVERISSSEGNPFIQMNNTQITIISNVVKITTSNPAGACLGYFIAGMTYLWFAW